MTDDARLGPDDLVGRHFAVVLRGYDRNQVDEFLFRAATSWRTSLAGSSIVAPAVHEPAGGNGPTAPVTFDSSARPVEAQVVEDTGETADAVSDLPRRERTLTDIVAPGGVSNGAQPESDHDAGADLDEGAAVAADVATVPDGAEEAAPDASPTQAEIARDRTVAFAERKAAELDRATARIELARAQEEALRIVDGAQRRAESVLIGTRDRARVAAEAVLSEARARLGPLLEHERTTRVSLTRLSHDVGVVAGAGSGLTPALPEAGDLVTEAEDDPDTPPAPFPIDIDSGTDQPDA